MEYSPQNRKILEELERRKELKENPCDSCDGTGRSSSTTEGQILVCGHCLGQRILLTEDEYRLVKEMALTGSVRYDDDSILDLEEFEYEM
jgi:Tryptophan RNA-binding attenuator protein inhibitory protein